MEIRSKDILTNLKNWNFECCGAFKIQENEAEVVKEALAMHARIYNWERELTAFVNAVLTTREDCCLLFALAEVQRRYPDFPIELVDPAGRMSFYRDCSMDEPFEPIDISLTWFEGKILIADDLRFR